METLTRLTIEKLSAEGRGIARHAGKVCFVAGALPGEVVVAERVAVRARFDEYRATAIEHAAAARVVPPCPWYGRCGGCDLQHLAPPAQLAHKTDVVLDALARQAGLDPAQVEPPIHSPPFGYRERARLAVVTPRRGAPTVGFRESDSAKVVAVDTCAVLAPALAELPGELARLVGTLESPRAIGHLDLAVSEASDGTRHGVVGVRASASPRAGDCGRWLDFARSRALYLAFETDDDAIEVAFAPVAEPMGYRLPAFDLRLAFAPGDFVQANGVVNRALVERLVAWIDPAAGMRVLDAFAGLGNFSLPLARRGASVIALEVSRRMVESAVANAARNGVPGVEFAVRDLMTDAPDLGRAPLDAAVLDPPRAGAAYLVADLVRRAVPRIVYVSCMPASLGRDAKMLAEAGYALARIAVVDMFPETGHVEAMAEFVRSGRRRSRRRGDDRRSIRSGAPAGG